MLVPAPPLHDGAQGGGCARAASKGYPTRRQGAGLTNKETLDFFTRFQGLPHGLCYARVLYGIDTYRVNRWMPIMVHTFVYRNKKTILTTFSVLNLVDSILGTLKSLLKAR